MKNIDRVREQMRQNFKEQLRSDITAASAVMNIDEIRTIINSVSEEQLSFLDKVFEAPTKQS